MTKISQRVWKLYQAFILKLHSLEATPVGEQVFRVARLAAFAVAGNEAVTQFLHGQGSAKAAAAGAAIALETVFRQLVPTSGSLWSKLVAAAPAQVKAIVDANSTPPAPEAPKS